MLNLSVRHDFLFTPANDKNAENTLHSASMVALNYTFNEFSRDGGNMVLI